MPPRITYDQPVSARLVVKLENGKEWEAGLDDFKKFGLVKSLDAYFTFDDRLRQILVEHGVLTADQEITEAALNPIRYFVEIALNHPDLLDHPEMTETFDAISEIERVLRESLESTDIEATRDPHDTTADELRLHLLTEHSNLAALGLPGAEAAKHHDHEHSGPGTIRNHDHDSRVWSLRKGLSMIGDIEYDTVIGNNQITDTLGSFHDHIDRISANPNGHDPIEANR